MAEAKLAGYVGKILRVDLSKKKISEEKLDEGTLKKWVGGVAWQQNIFMKKSPRGWGGQTPGTGSSLLQVP